MISFEDPLALVVRVFEELYPTTSVEVVFVYGLHSEEECWGATDLETGSVPVIQIDVATPLCGAVEVLGHELAHVVAGLKAQHGPAWEAVFAAINERYNEKVESGDASWSGVTR